MRELQEQEYNPILAFKAQGEAAGEGMDDLAEESILSKQNFKRIQWLGSYVLMQLMAPICMISS